MLAIVLGPGYLRADEPDTRALTLGVLFYLPFELAHPVFLKPCTFVRFSFKHCENVGFLISKRFLQLLKYLMVSIPNTAL